MNFVLLVVNKQLTKQIHENENIRNRFESFEMFTNKGINKFNKWEEFILFYENYKFNIK